MMLSEESTFYISLLLSLAVIAYGYFEAKNIRVEKLIISTSKLPEGASRVRVAQISDLHLGVTVGEGILDKVINNINEEKPDIIVSTGDLVDGIIRHVNHLEERLKNIHAPLGKYAVIGNHELYGGINKTAQFIEDSGFKLLRGDGVTVDNTINIAGMDFLGGEAGRYIDDSSLKQEHDVLSNLTPGLFTLLLKHRSDVENESLGLFDLQLSGHTHKGQIFPMSLVTMLLFQYHTGFNRLENGSAIYTSRGTGTAGPPIRFLSTPEITIIDIVPR
jgi:predicted MPP superfamily phosphohydrolase